MRDVRRGRIDAFYLKIPSFFNNNLIMMNIIRRVLPLYRTINQPNLYSLSFLTDYFQKKSMKTQ